jgi:hypothetical protein
MSRKKNKARRRARKERSPSKQFTPPSSPVPWGSVPGRLTPEENPRASATRKPKPMKLPPGVPAPDRRDGPVRLGFGPAFDAEMERRLDLADAGRGGFHPAEEVFEELAQKYPSVRRALGRGQ